MDLPSLVLGFNPPFHMCRKPLHIVNPSTWIDPSKPQSLFIDVPCGKCSECIQSYRNDWRNRAYYESLQSFLDGKYILFDTLTYRNGSLPHLSDFVSVPKKLDFPCFRHSDFSKFMANLRIRLTRLGYDIDGLRYFYANEYGDDIRYTRRPHYHVLFFVPFNIPFDLLSNLVATCWFHGRTDGIPYRGYNYVKYHNLFTSMSDSSKFVVNYVTKYCTKQFAFSKLVQSRLDRILAYDFPTWQIAKSVIEPMHYQSKGFGTDALINIVGKDNLLNEGKFKIMQKNGMMRYVNLSKSIQRKLLYDYSRDDKGNVHWTLNADGFAYKKRFAFRQINFLLNRVAVFDLYNNYEECKQQVIDTFFVDGRFKQDSIDNVIDNSYNITSGLRNYSAVDYGFLRKRVFCGCDYGSKKDGFSFASLSQTRDPLNVGKHSFISLHDLSQHVITKSSPIVSYYMAKKSESDEPLEAMELLQHLQFIHSKTIKNESRIFC